MKNQNPDSTQKEPFKPSAAIVSQLNPGLDQKWKILLKNLTFFNVMFIGLPLIAWLVLLLMPDEYGLFFLPFGMALLLGFIVVIADLIVLFKYFRLRKSQGRNEKLPVLLWGGAILIVGAPSIMIFYTFIWLTLTSPANDATSKPATSSPTVIQSPSPYSEIKKTEAIELLQACKIKNLFYTNQTDTNGGTYGETSKTGIVLTKDADKNPLRLSIAERFIPELVPIAREAQKTCPDLQFWRDGRYEEKQADGTWR